MDVIHLSAGSKAKSLSAVAKDLNLSPQFASPSELQLTVLLLSKHIDELRLRVGLLETELRMSRWRKLLRWWVRA